MYNKKSPANHEMAGLQASISSLPLPWRRSDQPSKVASRRTRKKKQQCKENQEKESIHLDFVSVLESEHSLLARYRRKAMHRKIQ